jgi:signal transduction histidine kinase/CheY-like chemotaxis protein/purine-cytosine permease-like protein
MLHHFDSLSVSDYRLGYCARAMHGNASSDVAPCVYCYGIIARSLQVCAGASFAHFFGRILDSMVPPSTTGIQRIIKVRRDYNNWVANETLEDYALRFAPRSFRKWPELHVANTALGGAASFLALEAIGGALVLSFGFVNTFWAILFAGALIFVTGLPISYYAARAGIDMDLLTRGAGFGYVGSTIASLVYASFTFLFFALEATIMALALELACGIPLAWSYLLCAIVVMPLVMHGITFINRLQKWTAPPWLVMLLVPYLTIMWRDPHALSRLALFPGVDFVGSMASNHFAWLPFFAASSIVLSLIAQIGEQVDYLRFLPPLGRKNRLRWWSALLVAGPGWIVFGGVKMLGGALLAMLAIEYGVPSLRAAEPTQMYLTAYRFVFPSNGWALAAMAVLVVLSQIKINVTNAYAGSLAWSNFFARVTRSHPGRVVWLVFNISIALLLMESGIYSVLHETLSLFANVSMAWVATLVADLLINKPLGLSSPQIEFKRAHLYDINPVGVVSMGVASILSLLAHAGAFGPLAQVAAPLVALTSALVLTPLLAWLTHGRYYIARASQAESLLAHTKDGQVSCVICEHPFEIEDMAQCPAYGAPICSLCCSLDARCNDLCRPHSNLTQQWERFRRWLLPGSQLPRLHTRLIQYFWVLGCMLVLLSAIVYLVYEHELPQLVDLAPAALRTWHHTLFLMFLLLAMAASIGAWWLVLTWESRRVARDETDRQTVLLMQEIEAHKKTDEALQQAKELAEAASRAKSRYVTGLSHELRTPLNSILGYAQILQREPGTLDSRSEGLATIQRSGEHLLTLIDGLLDVARIEAGKLALQPSEMRFTEFLENIVRMFKPQAQSKGLGFIFEIHGRMPEFVRADEKRVRQILINLLGNAVRYTEHGHVSLRARYSSQIATLEVADTGIGIPPDYIDRVFDPFERGKALSSPDLDNGGAGLGLPICSMLTELMGGKLSVDSVPGEGSVFQVKLFLPEVRAPRAKPDIECDPAGYAGEPKCILVVDDRADQRMVIDDMLAPLGFDVVHAASGADALTKVSLQVPDLILMDLSMQPLDGWETTRLIREDLPRTMARPSYRPPIIVVSANAFDADHDRAFSAGCDDYLAKPVRRAELLDKLGTLLQLEWITVHPPQQPRSEIGEPTPQTRFIDVDSAELMREYSAMGHVRGLLDRLNDLQSRHTSEHAVIAHLMLLAKRFAFDEFNTLLRKVENVSS